MISLASSLHVYIVVNVAVIRNIFLPSTFYKCAIHLFKKLICKTVDKHYIGISVRALTMKRTNKCHFTKSSYSLYILCVYH